MLDFLHMVFIEPFISGDVMECILAFIMWILFLLIVILILWGVFYVFDSFGLSTYETKGTIINKYHEPPYTSTTMITTGKTVTPITNYHPESWQLEIEANEGRNSIFTSQNFYNKCNIEDIVKIEYYKGRFSDKFYIKKILGFIEH